MTEVTNAELAGKNGQEQAEKKNNDDFKQAGSENSENGNAPENAADQDNTGTSESMISASCSEYANLPTTVNADSLPLLLKSGLELFSKQEEQELFLISTLAMCSGLFINIKGIYGKREMYPNLYLMVVAPPASGKSVMNHSKTLARAIHDKFLHGLGRNDLKKTASPSSEKEIDEKEAEENKKGSIVVLIPGNASSSRFINHLDINNKNNAPSIVIESEIDTISKSFANEWGDFSDVLRAAWHNEPVGLTRSEGNAYIDISCPKLAVALSGTMNQVRKLISNVEDGLYSRFIVYKLSQNMKWEDVSCDSCPNLNEVFFEMSNEYLDLFLFVSSKKRQFTLSQSQWKQLNAHFERESLEAEDDQNFHAAGIIRRHGAMLFKLCMILTAIRMHETGNNDDNWICIEQDFISALFLIQKSLVCSLEVIKEIPGGRIVSKNKIRDALYSALLDTFETRSAIALGRTMGIEDRTVERYLKYFLEAGLTISLFRGKYKKISEE